jgi:hypothetical protein
VGGEGSARADTTSCSEDENENDNANFALRETDPSLVYLARKSGFDDDESDGGELGNGYTYMQILIL